MKQILLMGPLNKLTENDPDILFTYHMTDCKRKTNVLWLAWLPCKMEDIFDFIFQFLKMTEGLVRKKLRSVRHFVTFKII